MWAFLQHLGEFFYQATKEHTGELIASLAGAFAGAGAAFYLENREQKRKDENEKYYAIIRSQHALTFMWRVMRQLQKQKLEPIQNHEDRHRRFGIFYAVQETMPIDIGEITFLFRRGHRQVLANIFAAERSYLNALDALRTRNEAIEELKKAIEGKGEFNPKTGETTMPYDPERDSNIKNETDNLFNAVSNAVKAITIAFEELRSAAKTAFPKMEFLQSSNLSDEALEKPPGKS